MSVDRILSLANPLVAAILRSPLHALLSGGLALVTVHGHRSGRRYSIPVGYQREGNCLTIFVSEARRKKWWRNYVEPGPIEVLLRGRERSARAAVLSPSSPEFDAAAERTLERMPFLGRVFGVPDYDRRRGLTPSQADVLRREVRVVRIALDAGSW